MRINHPQKRGPVYLCAVLLLLLASPGSPAQCPDNRQAGENLAAIELNNSMSVTQKVSALHLLKNEFEKCKLPWDSVYARIFNRISFYEFKLSDGIATNSVIENNLKAIEINRAAKQGSSRNLALNSYKNLGIYYTGLSVYNKALDYFDSSILIAHNMPEQASLLISIRFNKIAILLETGDYQKAVEESTIGRAESGKNNDSLSALQFLSQRAQSYYMQNQLNRALSDADQTLLYAGQLNNDFEKASALKVKALIHAGYKNFPAANYFFEKAVTLRSKIKDVDYQIADDYADYGNFFLNDMQDYKRAVACYHRTIEFANRASDAGRLAKAHLNLGVVSYHQHRYEEALQYNVKALTDHKIITSAGNPLKNPSSDRLTSVSNKELLLFIFGNKTEILLAMFKQTADRKYLHAALQTALLTDTLITGIRHEQKGELSKLYWRNKTREFYTNAMEASYLNNNTELAFIFMEKSRAVLLNDKLNEIGAAAQLPEAEAGTEQQYKIRVITAQQQLNALPVKSAEYDKQLLILLSAKDSLEQYIKSLDKRFPVYFQYKYEDNVPSLTRLQNYLRDKNQSFVYYFTNDTVAYIICISGRDTKMCRLSKNEFNYDLISRYTRMCSEKATQNLHYDSFASLSHRLYNVLFKPLQIRESRVIICPDNFLLPFEALSTDKEGQHFLIEDYAFSYVYSARYLLKVLKTFPADGNFLGFAPESFRPYLRVPPLKQSTVSLEQMAGYYKSSKLFTRDVATRNNFLKNLSRYAVVNVFSHAYADTSDNEPMLYMHDSVIHLSELRLAIRQSTRLVVLSACQTNVGMRATGEGIYSLARGFASAGIPAVAATCWEADEPATYAVSGNLHQYISKGEVMDVAMQKAKLDFLKQNRHNERSLPYFWANMVIMGNTEPVNLNTHSSNWLLILAVCGLALLIIIFLFRQKLVV